MKLNKYVAQYNFVARPIGFLVSLVYLSSVSIRMMEDWYLYFILLVPVAIVSVKDAAFVIRFFSKKKKEKRLILFLSIGLLISCTVAGVIDFDGLDRYAYFYIGVALGFVLSLYITLNSLFNENKENIIKLMKVE